MQSAEAESDVFERMAVQLGITFTFDGDEMESAEVFSTDCLLPLIYFSANKIAKELDMTEPTGCAVRKSQSALFGVEAYLDGRGSAASRLMLCLDAFMQAIKTGMQNNVFEITTLFETVSREMFEELGNVKPEQS